MQNHIKEGIGAITIPGLVLLVVLFCAVNLIQFCLHLYLSYSEHVFCIYFCVTFSLSFACTFSLNTDTLVLLLVFYFCGIKIAI